MLIRESSPRQRRKIRPEIEIFQSDSTAEYRFCHGGVSAKYLSNMIIIALIQEISVGS